MHSTTITRPLAGNDASVAYSGINAANRESAQVAAGRRDFTGWVLPSGVRFDPHAARDAIVAADDLPARSDAWNTRMVACMAGRGGHPGPYPVLSDAARDALDELEGVCETLIPCVNRPSRYPTAPRTAGKYRRANRKADRQAGKAAIARQLDEHASDDPWQVAVLATDLDVESRWITYENTLPEGAFWELTIDGDEPTAPEFRDTLTGAGMRGL